MKFSSLNPATGEIVWTGEAAGISQVNAAIECARAAGRDWASRPHAEREQQLREFALVLTARKAELAGAISREVGKPTWEALTEVQTMIGKVEVSIKAHAQRCAEFAGGPAVTRFRPHGVVAVFGPFNFPGHLPNGHIVPALLAGNTVIFKPSEKAPLVAELTAAIWREAGLPDGVFNLVQGGRETGAALVDSPRVNGLFFTGSAATGLWLAEKFARTPERILALELGGNNPLVVWQPRDLQPAALLTVQSAYLTAGQRCTCARRLIVPTGGSGDAFLAALIRQITTIKVGPFTDDPEPFMGPVISAAAADQVLAAQGTLLASGAGALVESKTLRPGTGLLSPGLIDVTAVPDRRDEEIFGPLLQVIRVVDFDAAIAEANATRFGLAAGLICDDGTLYSRFRAGVHAGLINWNQQLTGASGAAPFGGIGHSGNHRPSAFFAADYCSYPVASIEIPELKLPDKLPPGLTMQFPE
ncbi:MAG: succinylglutamate-semialdehyde dehydrogenase [Cephaloticoccus sp.]|nr:succinylglutamate-semialdehyde dehydrogenase [Cephaloticoccus sp.]